MTIAHKIIHAQDFIKTTATGELDLDRSKKILHRIAEESGSTGEYDILLDVRDTTNIMTDAEFQELEGALCIHREAFQNKLAVLHSGKRLDRADYLEQAWRSRGYNVAHFIEYEAAMEWLNEVTYFHIDYDPDDPSGNSD